MLILKFLLTFFILLIVFKTEAFAETTTSDNYQIQMGNFNMSAGLPVSDTYIIGLTGGQNAPGLFTSNGYYVKSGFWYIFPMIPFQFTITNLDINFGVLVPGTPSTLTSTLTISSPGVGGYQISASESAQLSTLQGTPASIPDTSCNGGANTCTPTSAKIWNDNSKTGFGYNMSGDDIASDFLGSTYFRPFSTWGEVVMSRGSPGKNRVGTVTYKVNIDGSQGAGTYQNYILFIATPTY